MSTGIIDQAMDYIATNDTVKNGTFTKSQVGITPYLAVKERNGVVTVNGFITSVTVTANTDTYLGKISNVGLPGSGLSVRTLCSVGSNAYTAGTLSYVTLGTNGELHITSSNGGSGKAVYFTMSYCVG